MKQKIRFILCGMLIMATLIGSVHAATFSDVSKNASYAEAVDYVSSTGLMVGYGDGKFQPEKTVTRAEMATVLCKLLGEDKNLKKDGSKFMDVPTSHWGNAYVAKAASLGILSGYGNGKFGPDDTVTFEQALTMMVNALGYGDLAGQYGGYPNGYVTVAKNRGLLTNVNGKVGDRQNRANVAIMLLNLDTAPKFGFGAQKAEYDIVWQDRSYRKNGEYVLENWYDQVILRGKAEAQKKINQIIAKDCEEFLVTLDESDKRWLESERYLPYENTNHADVTHNANGLFSVRMSTGSFWGGMFHNREYGMTFDLNSGKRLELKDLLGKNEGLLPYLRTLVYINYAKEMEYAFQNPWEKASMHMRSLDEVAFYLSNGEIVLCMPYADSDLTMGYIPTGIYVCGEKTQAPSNWKKLLTKSVWCTFEKASENGPGVVTECTFNSDNTCEIWGVEETTVEYRGTYSVSNNGLLTIKYKVEAYYDDFYGEVPGDGVTHEVSFGLQVSGKNLVLTQSSEKKDLLFDGNRGKVVVISPEDFSSFVEKLPSD